MVCDTYLQKPMVKSQFPSKICKRLNTFDYFHPKWLPPGVVRPSGTLRSPNVVPHLCVGCICVEVLRGDFVELLRFRLIHFFSTFASFCLGRLSGCLFVLRPIEHFPGCFWSLPVMYSCIVWCKMVHSCCSRRVLLNHLGAICPFLVVCLPLFCMSVVSFVLSRLLFSLPLSVNVSLE